MARTIEQILRDYLGDQVLTLAKISADLEAAREELASYKAKEVPQAGPKPNGRDQGAPEPRRPGA